MQDLHDQINDYQSQLDKGLEFQELMKKANAIVKKHEANKLERGLANKELVDIGLTYTQAEQVLTPDFMGRKGFPQYKLTNNNANNKRLKDRIEQIKTKLQGAKAVKNTGQAEEYVFDGGTIEVNYEIDRVQILFPGGRVDKELFKKLRSNGYVYSPTNQAFQRKITPQAIRNAIYLFDAKKVTDTPRIAEKILAFGKTTEPPKPEINGIYKPLSQVSGLIGAMDMASKLSKQYNTTTIYIINWKDEEPYDLITESQLIELQSEADLVNRYRVVSAYMQGSPIKNPNDVSITSETHLEPNTPEEFDNAIFDAIQDELPDRWIGDIVKQRVVANSIASKIKGNSKDKSDEVKRLFKKLYEKTIFHKNYIGAKELQFDPVYSMVNEIKAGKTTANVKMDKNYYQKITEAILPKIEPHWIGKQTSEVALRNQIWSEIQKDTTSNVYSNEEKVKAMNEIYNQVFNAQREKEYSYDKDLAEKYVKVLNMNPEDFNKKFGVKKLNINDYLRASFTFKDDNQSEIDLTLNLLQTDLYGQMSTDTWNRIEDIQYWLRNATQYLYDQPDLILANLKTTNREWTSHPKGYAKGIIAPKLSEIKKYQVGDILVATKNIEKPNKFSIFYQKGERIKIDKISDLPNEITTYIVENMDYMGNNEKEFYNALPETYLNDNFENQQPMEIKEKVATSNLKPGDLIMINNVKYKVQRIKDERLLVTNLSDTEIPNRTDDFNLEYALANYSKIDDNVETKTIKNSYTPDRIENRLLNPKGIQTFLTNKYDNQYQLNKGIEEFMTNKGAEPSTYSAEEKAFIKKYSGYGGLSKFGTAGKGAFFEYYTPTPVIRKMWALAYKYGYKGGSILESSVGTGEFLALAPTDASITAYEINPFSADICRILYPQAKVFTQPFEQNFIENNFTIKDRVIPIYDLCIGNCPYGSFEIVQSRYLSGMGELKHVQAKNYAEYFLRRSLDLLKSGGLLILIIGADVVNGGKLFLDSDISPVKEYLAEHSDLLDAYRLPDSVFERTQVTTEIVVIQKK